MSQRVLGDRRKGEPFEQETDGDVSDQGAVRDRDGDSVTAFLDLPDHSGPSAQGQKCAGQVRVPLLLRDTESVERIEDALGWVQPGDPLDLPPQPAEPPDRRPARPAVGLAKRLKKASTPAGQAPTRE